MTMKNLILTLAVIFPAALWASSVHQCEDAQGNMSFTSDPCQSHSTTLSTLDSKSGQNRRLKNTAIKRVIINNQAEFDQFAENLSFNNMSDVLRGIQNSRFHGVKLSYLLKQKDIQYKSNPNKMEEPQYFADIKRGNTQNHFSVGYKLNVKGKAAHPFLNLSNEKLISRMRSLGFGKPKVSNDVYKWTWRDGGVSCQFNYKRIKTDDNKFFKYQCSEFGY